MFYFISFLISKALSIIVVSALTAIGGALPLIGLLYWHYQKIRTNLEGRLEHYNKSIKLEEENLSKKQAILDKFADQGIDFDNLIRKFNDRLLFKDQGEVTAFKTFREVEQQSWEINQKIEKIKSKVFYIENFNFSFYIGSIFNKKYFDKEV